jgi:hypothetical protein
VSTLQLVAQAAGEPPHLYGVQSCVVGEGIVHIPVPLHVWAFVSVLPEHDEATQMVAFGQSMQLPAPSHCAASSPHVDAAAEVHTFLGSLTPNATGWQTPSTPLACPVLALVQAWHEPVHGVLQHTPSAHVSPFWQSDVALHFWPWAQRFAHVAVLPPQSTSVSLPSFLASLQLSIPPQVSEMLPHVVLCFAQVVGVQPQTIAVPPPPQVCGSVQSALLMQPHWPCGLHTKPPVEVGVGHVMPALMVVDGTPPVQWPVWQSLGNVGRSASSATIMVPPLPSHTIFWQSPAICAGFVVVAVPAAVFVVVQLPLAHVGCWQSLMRPGHSLSLSHWSQWPIPSQ